MVAIAPTTCRDSEWTRIQTTSARKTLLLGQIKMATHNLYTLMSKHLQRKILTKESEDTMMQLGRVRPGGVPELVQYKETHVLLPVQENVFLSSG